VITGAGRAFSAGLDLIDLDTEVSELPAAEQREMVARLNPLCQAISDAPVPVLAAVNGPCAGGGLGLALLADITIDAELLTQAYDLAAALARSSGPAW
jgi:2-(1,2-epoxy-1,2-dihydrophenyl)acetyl-CoA isomerase